MNARLSDYIDWIEHLDRARLAETSRYYSDDACFKDPFNEVRGSTAIRAVFEHMFAQLDDVHFRVTGSWHASDSVMLAWDFEFRFKGSKTAHCVAGVSQLGFADDGRINAHRDFWDPAEGLYQHLPLIGAALRWLKRRMRA